MKSQGKTNRLVMLFFLVTAIAGLVYITVEIEEVVATLQQADWRALSGALLAAVLSYTCMSLSFALVGQTLGVRMGQRDLALVGFISNVINHVISTGGVAGYSLRYLLMKRHGVPFKDVLAVSVLHFYLTSLDMLIMFPVGVVYLLNHAPVSNATALPLGLLTIVVAGLAALAALLIFARSWRRSLLNLVNRVAGRLTRRDFGRDLRQIDETMGRGVAAIRRAPHQLLLIMILTWVDWFGSVFVLSFCLNAFGPEVPFGIVVTGFVLGIMAGLASMVPGGLGVQEGSMTGVFVLLGVPAAQALLAAILFRAVFFFLPYLVSLGMSRRLLHADQLLDPYPGD